MMVTKIIKSPTKRYIESEKSLPLAKKDPIILRKAIRRQQLALEPPKTGLEPELTT